MRNSKGVRYFALLGILALIVAACGDDVAAPDACDADSFGCVEIAPGDPIKIGSLLVITGPDAALGIDSQYGVELALDWFGANAFDRTNTSIKGHQVTLTAGDDGCSAEGGTTGANALVADSQLVAVVGTSCSSSALGVADQIMSQRGISMVSPSNTAIPLTAPATHQPFYLRTAHNDAIQGVVVASFAYNFKNLRSAATIHDGSPYAEGLANSFAAAFRALGGTITKQESIVRAETDFTSVLTDIAADSPDFLFFPIFPAEAGFITQQARTIAGLANTTLAGADGIANTTYLSAAGDAGNGVFVSGPDLTAFSGDVNFYQGAFLTEYRARWGEPASVFHAHAFDATMMILTAIEAVSIQVGDHLFIPRTALKNRLFAMANFPGITGNLTCDANGDCQQLVTIGVNEVVSGAFTASPVFSEAGNLGN